MRRFSWILLLAVVLAALRGAGAQSVPVVRLDRPDAEFATGFTQITSLRELSDGRVIVTDGREELVRLVNLATGASAQIGRRGEGPGEYEFPRRLSALRGDTTLLADTGNERYLVILPGGALGPTFRAPDPDGFSLTVRGVDAAGRFYYQAQPSASRESFGKGSGTAQLIRLTRSSGRVDTIAVLAVAAGREEGAMTLGNGMLRRLTNRPLAAEDVTAIGPDGRVAVVRVRDYHVEWFDPAAVRTMGPPVAFDVIRVTSVEKRAFMDAQVVPGQIISNQNSGGRSMPLPGPPPSMSGAADAHPIPAPFAEANIPWPAEKPPFLGATAASIAADGMLWVRRTTAYTDSVPRYDVFDAAGRLTRRVELPKRTRVVGFGRGVVYLARIDADDVEHLQRFRM